LYYNRSLNQKRVVESQVYSARRRKPAFYRRSSFSAH